MVRPKRRWTWPAAAAAAALLTVSSLNTSLICFASAAAARHHHSCGSRMRSAHHQARKRALASTARNERRPSSAVAAFTVRPRKAQGTQRAKRTCQVIPSTSIWTGGSSCQYWSGVSTPWDPTFLTRNTRRHMASTSSADEAESLYERLKSLSSEIRHHDELYYNTGQPILTDDEYDALTRKEAELCKANPDLVNRLEIETGLGQRATRWGGRVGHLVHTEGEDDKAPIPTTTDTKAAVPAGRTRGKLAHMSSSPMMSLDNAMNDNDVVRWINRARKLLLSEENRVQVGWSLIDNDKSDGGDAEGGANGDGNTEDTDVLQQRLSLDILAEPKMDGLSLSLRYELVDVNDENDVDGNKCTKYTYQFKWGATRGDGTRGENVTEGVLPLLDSELGTIPAKFCVKCSPEDANYSPLPVLEIRGEVVLPKTCFQDLQDTYDGAALASDSNDSETKKDEISDDSSPILPIRFANARNAASGILLRSKEELDEKEAANTRKLRSYLRFYAYDVADEGSSIFGSDGDAMRASLEEFGFNVPLPIMHTSFELTSGKEVSSTELAGLYEYHQRLMALREADESSKDKLDYDIDGAVYKISHESIRMLLGASARAPRWAIAHKFPTQAAVTSIKDIEIQVGRTGALTPVAVLEPIDIGGVSVARASLHNFWYAAQLLCPDHDGTLSHPRIKRDTEVVVGRAGDVIPQVMRLVRDEKYTSREEGTGENIGSPWISLDPPPACPACGAKTVFDISIKENQNVKDEGNAGDTAEPVSGVSGQVLRCSAPQLLCPPRAVGALSHAFSRPGLDVSGLSDARLQQLVDEGLIHVPADLFRIVKEDLESIASLSGWGPKSSQKLASVLNEVSSDGVALSRFIYSLGIRHIGVHTSKLLAAAYGTVDAFLEEIDEAATGKSNKGKEGPVLFRTLASEEGIKGIGPVMIQSLVTFSENEALVKAAKDLANAVIVLDDASFGGPRNNVPTRQNAAAAEASLPFEGLTVVFTGAVPEMSRSESQEAALLLGATKTPGSISGATDLVIEGIKGGKKAAIAREKGIKVMDAVEFLRLVQDLAT